MLQVQNLVAGYGKLQILDGVSIEARPGEVTVIVGPNGSGKSTLLKSISGLTTIFSGTIQVDDQNLSRLHPHIIARMGIAYLPQTENVFTNLSVKENITLSAYTLHKEEAEERIKDVMETFPQLKNYLSTKATNLSGGERQMLAIGRALMSKPALLLLDEPSLGLQPQLVIRTFDAVTEIHRRGMAV